ncbi:LacI family DNA-binding transcriptional regulator [Amnibacterium kyonggiense]|uniref:LacI family transcriptional regulator n=1 Tax=Amnibacterium kyonggiense TaxID=595671 RepID=A0A4R7FSC1_9MICO|nr:LacI family DNA-binding transcriptional regulator [Amnibacterium kyonggiense]TDS80638.1 LacI family transcriptional regulator [Amnibacterium kyonggiense]
MEPRELRLRPPSIRDVADRAGVSYQTVSRMLNAHPGIRADTERRIRAAIDELGYRPNRAARALVTARSRMIGVLLTARPLHGPFSSFLAIVDAVRERGYSVTTTPDAGDDPADLVHALEELLAHGVEGIVAIAPQDRAREAVRLSGAPVPVLTLQGVPGELNDFGFDQHEGAVLATRHLLDLGHRRIAHLAGPVGWGEAEQRQRGYERAMLERGLEPRVLSSDWTPDGGMAVGRRLLSDERPTAVFAANDEMAVGLLAAAHDLGLAVPDDLSVVGFDDVPFARYLRPALTTVRQDFGDLGRRAIALLIDEIEGMVPDAPPPAVPSSLVVRDSTGQVTI